MKYRTRPRAHFLCRYSFLIVTVLILALAATAAFADKPPPAIYEMVRSTAVPVHNGTCKLPQKQVAKTDCLLYHDAARELIYMILFAKQGNNLYVSHIYAIDAKEEVHTLWTHPQHTA